MEKSNYEKCPACGFLNRPDAITCADCGLSLTVEAIPKTICRCPVCNQEYIEFTPEFCKCGYNFVTQTMTEKVKTLEVVDNSENQDQTSPIIEKLDKSCSKRMIVVGNHEDVKESKKRRLATTFPMWAFACGLLITFALPPPKSYLKGFIQGGTLTGGFMCMGYFGGKLFDVYLCRSKQAKKHGLFAVLKVWFVALVLGLCLLVVSLIMFCLWYEIILRWSQSS